MAGLSTDIPKEEAYVIEIGSGMYTSDLPSNIPDGFSAICYNMVATGDSLENRIGIRKSSVDWKVTDNAPRYLATVAPHDQYFFSQIDPWGFDSTMPAFVWASSGFVISSGAAAPLTLHLVRANGVSGAGDGYMAITTASACIGACQYAGTMYFSLSGGGIRKVSSIDWSADTVTHALVASSGTGTFRGIFVFKDRMWGWGTGSAKHKLFFTDIAATGGQPETWAVATNVIPIVGPSGNGAILKIVPLGNRLAIFTTNGLYTLLVEGAPASWILRVLDSKSICTTSQCAFESKGIIYFVNTQGVWATNTLAVRKLSGVIEDQWFVAKGLRTHTINQYEDGMIVSISKHSTVPDNYVKTDCRTFYSKLDPIAWTEWNMNRNDLGTDPYQLAQIWSTTEKIPTYLNAEPTVYVMTFMTDSTEAAKQRPVAQFLIMDGGTDEYSTRAGTLINNPVGIYLKTKHFDGENPYRMKHAKRGIMEFFSSDVGHEIVTSWDSDYTIDSASEIRLTTIDEFTVGLAANSIKVPADFRYRRASLNVRCVLQSATSQIKIRQIVLFQDTGTNVPEIVD